MSTTEDHRLAARLATEAGALLVALRSELEAAGADVAEMRAEGDRRSHDLLVNALSLARPDDAVLSEEGRDDQARLTASRIWIIDPLDGTREFGEPPRVDWAVHVALVEGGAVTAAAVSLPARDLTLCTADVAQAPTGDGTRPRVIASRTRPGAAAEAIAEALDGDLVFLGSAGAKTMAVVLGEADIYAHTGGQYEWDSAAPVGVAAAAGLHVSRIDGSPLVYNRPDPLLPDLLVCRHEHAAAALEAVSALDS